MVAIDLYQDHSKLCEQNSAEDMGYTSSAMDKALRAAGFRAEERMKVLHLYKKGDCEKRKEILDAAVLAGEKPGKTILLADRVKNSRERGADRSMGTGADALTAGRRISHVKTVEKRREP